MPVYKIANPTSPLAAVEFTPASDGNFTFFYADSHGNKESVRRWLLSPEVGQKIMAETMVDGQPVFITHGDKTAEELKKILDARGDQLHYEPPRQKLTDVAWQMRSALGFSGQCLQLTSSFMRGKVDWGLCVFAVSNIAANSINLLFGAQKTEDVNRLRFLKGQINEDVDDYVADPSKLPGVDDKRLAMRTEAGVPTKSQQARDFMQRNSVTVGELGLRYFGAGALAFPTNNWGKAWQHLKEGNVTGAYRAGRSTSYLSHAAGLGSIAGKTIALLSKTPDPYDKKHHSWLDSIRENYTFRIGGGIEAISFATMSYDAFAHQKIHLRGKKRPDYLSGIGAAMFAMAYITRHWAQFGVKETNMDELYAHATDGLAQVPPEKLPQVIAEAAVTIKEHFRDKPMDYGQIYSQMMMDLYRYHHIALEDPSVPADHAAQKPQTSANRRFAATHPAAQLRAGAELTQTAYQR